MANWLDQLQAAGQHYPADQGDRREGQFQSWARALPWYGEFQQQYGEPPNLNDPDYDYRTAFRAGITPQRYAPDEYRYHWPSTTEEGEELKSPTHPTYWAQQFMTVTGKDPFTLGVRSPEEAQAYFERERGR